MVETLALTLLGSESIRVDRNWSHWEFFDHRNHQPVLHIRAALTVLFIF